MKLLKYLVLAGILTAVVFGSTGLAAAQEKEKGGGGDLAAAAQNPVGAMYSLPFKFTSDFGAPDGSAYVLNIQPVIPVTVGNWNLISRAIIPLASVEGTTESRPEIPQGAPGDGASGLGDINYTVFLSPAKAGKLIWGVGPSISFPSATDDQLGSGKWSAGPSLVLLAQPKPFSVGVLVRQLWSFAGDEDRNYVSQFLIEPFINYNLDNGWYLISDMIITSNWGADPDQRWTVPIGGGFGKITKIGNQPINVKLEAYYNVVRPDSAPDWSTSFTLQFMFPK